MFSRSFAYIACLAAVLLLPVALRADVLYVVDNILPPPDDSEPRPIIYQIPAEGGAKRFFAEVPFPITSLVVDRAGNVFATDGASIFKFSPDGQRRTLATRMDGQTAMYRIALDPAGNLYAGTYFDPQPLSSPPKPGQIQIGVLRFSPDGATASPFVSRLPLDTLTAMKFDEKGNLYVAGSVLYTYPAGGPQGPSNEGAIYRLLPYPAKAKVSITN